MKFNTPILQDLSAGGLIREEHKTLFADKCRDLIIPVYRDTLSHIIYLSPDFEGHDASYYADKAVQGTTHPRNSMDQADTARRHSLLETLIAGKRYLDYGCGLGYQLAAARGIAKEVMGIELSDEGKHQLQNLGIRHSDNLEAARSFAPEVVSFFHVVEHLPDPVQLLGALYAICAPGTRLILEVPHAKDSLLMGSCQAFKDFTLWSEHLVLHTRQSLQYITEKAGWRTLDIVGTQRYPVWNHIGWLETGKPSGLSGAVADRTSDNLSRAYEAYLAARDTTDTLILHAEKC